MPRYPKKRSRQNGAPPSTKYERIGARHSIEHAMRRTLQAREIAAAARRRLENQIRINTILFEWRNTWRLFLNSPKKRVVPLHVRTQFETLEYHLAELTVLEREMERLAVEYEIAELNNDFEQKKRVERRMNHIEKIHKEVREDATLIARQLQNLWPLPFKRPGEGRKAAENRHRQKRKKR